MVTLRDYQLEDVALIEQRFAEHDSVAVELATGLGKTVEFSMVVKRRLALGPALIVAHREELIFQAARTFKAITDIEPDVEMAEMRADAKFFGRAPVVVASIQSLTSGSGDRRRLHRVLEWLGPLATLVIDEGHHAMAKTYLWLINEVRRLCPKHKLLMVSATWDRGDGKSFKKIVQAVGPQRNLLWGIENGWLVNVRQQFVQVGSLDLSHIKTRAGDFVQEQLAAEMEKNIQEVVCPIFEASMDWPEGTIKRLNDEAGGDGDALVAAIARMVGASRALKTLLFAVTVAHAKGVCDYLNGMLPGEARFISGETPKDERRQILRDYEDGAFTYLCNCAVATEGFDCPSIQMVAPKPTKSRALYAQMVGRGTRSLPGTVERWGDKETRLASIRFSKKPSVLIVDIAANAGQHQLVTTMDLLAGNASKEAAQRAIVKAKKDGGAVDVKEALARAQLEAEELARRRAAVVPVANYTRHESDPWALTGERRVSSMNSHAPMMPWQRKLLQKHGVKHLETMGRRQAFAIIGKIRKGQWSGISGEPGSRPAMRTLSPDEFLAWVAGAPIRRDQ